MANERVMHDDLELYIVRHKGRYNIKFSGTWSPKDIAYMQKYITDMYRSQRKKIAQEYKKSNTKIKQQYAELKVKERDLKHKENELNALNPISSLESTKKFNEKVGLTNATDSGKSSNGNREQSSCTVTSGIGHQKTTGSGESKSGSTDSTKHVDGGQGRTSTVGSKAGGKNSAGAGVVSGKTS